MYKKLLAFALILIMVSCFIMINASKSEASSEGWRQTDGGWWYEFSDGTYAKSEYIDGYWLDADGWYDSAWNGSWYYNSTGWWFQSGSWYPVNEWVKIDKKWYYFNSDGYWTSEYASEETQGQSSEEAQGQSSEENQSQSSEEVSDQSSENEEMDMVMYIGDKRVDVSWEDNQSVEELKNLASSGLSISMSMYGGFEQVGSIGQSITRNDKNITTEAGDIVLYSGNQMVVFYGSNTWSYTRLGKINLSKDELKDLLSNGNVTITLSME